MREHLIGAFERAGVTLVLEDAPMRGTDKNIFQMDIGRKLRRGKRIGEREEFFRIWPGAEENLVEVAGFDKEIRQLVLVVKEPAREFEDHVPKNILDTAKKRFGTGWENAFCKENRIDRSSLRITYDKKGGVTGAFVTRRTQRNKRHYLCGVDERQLFIAQLPKAVSTVRDAHACLKAPQVTFFEGKASGRTIRQGEWFFVNVTDEEKKAINDLVRREGARKKQSVGSGSSRPHIADEVVHLPGVTLAHGFPVRETEIFVRGAVKHPDHATVRFGEWRKVIRNTERTENRGGFNGVFWID